MILPTDDSNVATSFCVKALICCSSWPISILHLVPAFAASAPR